MSAIGDLGRGPLLGLNEAGQRRQPTGVKGMCIGSALRADSDASVATSRACETVADLGDEFAA